MSLATCFAKMNSGKPVFNQAEIDEIMALANKKLAENPKAGMPFAEKAAVFEMYKQAKAELNEVVNLINEAKGEPVAEKAPVVAKAETPAPSPEAAPEPVVKRKKKTVDVKAAGMAAQAAPDVAPAEEATVDDDPDVLMLNELRRLASKDKKHGPTAKDYLTRASNGENVREEAGAWLNALRDDGVLESTANTNAIIGQDADALRDKLRKWFFNPAMFDKRVVVVQSEDEVPSNLQKSRPSNDWSRRLGFYDPKSDRVYMIAGHIPPGRELGVFLHEVGGHMGMRNLLGKVNYDALVNQIKAWANETGSIENDLAVEAMTRIAEAEFARGITLDDAVKNDELIAYFIESAVAEGIDPSAIKTQPKGMQVWFIRLWNAVKAAVQKLGINPSTLKAQDVVDLAYGAARLQLSGSNTDLEAANAASGRPMTEVYTPMSNVADSLMSRLFGKKDDTGAELSRQIDEAIWHNKGVERERTAMLGGKLRRLEHAKKLAEMHREDMRKWGAKAVEEEFEYEPGSFKNTMPALFHKQAKAQLESLETRVAEIQAEIDEINAKYDAKLKPVPSRQETLDSIASARVQTNQMIDQLPDPVREGARWMNDSFRDLGRKALHFSIFTQDLVDSVKSVLPSAADWFEAVNKRETQRITHEAVVDDIASNHIDKLSQSQFNRTWNLIHDMTKQAKWAYAPTWRSNVEVDPEMAARYEALDQIEKDAIDAVLKHGNDTLTEINKSLDKIANEMFDEKINRLTSPEAKAKLIGDKAKMLRMFGRKLSFPQGPYAPMRRVGTHVTVGKSQMYKDIEAQVKDGREDLRERLDEMRTDEKHYMVAFSESRAEAEALKREYQAKGFIATASAKEEFVEGDQLPFQAFQSLREMAVQREDKGAIKLINMIDELYLTALAETSARKSELRREGVAGLTPDTMYKAFLSKGKADAHYRAVLDTHREVADRFADMRRQAHESVDTRGEKMDAFNELKKRYDASFDYDPSPVVSKLMNFSTYWMLLTKPAYYLYNLTQPFMMTIPYISKKFDYTDAANQMVKAYGDLFAMQRGRKIADHFDLNALPDDIRSAMIELRDMGRLDITITQDLGKRIHSNRNNVSRYVSRMDAFFRTAAQKTEMANRVVTAAAAFRLSMAKNGDRAEAIKYAADVIDKTQGNYSNFNAPRLFNANSTARLMTQFRKFQLIQATLLVNMVRQSFTGHERAVNLRALSFMLGHHALLAGAMGLPAVNLIAMAFAMSGDDEEPRDLELWMKNNLGDDSIGQVLRYGVPALFNVNMSQNVGMGQTFSAVPYANIDATRSGYDSLVTALMGPSIGGLGPQLWTAGGKGLEGDYYGMLAGMMPGFVKTTMNSIREAQEGATNRAGDTLVTAEEIVFMDTLLKSAGFKTMKDSTRQLVTQKRYEFDAFFNDRTRELRKAYNKAYKDGDGLKMAELRDRWVEMQQFKRDYGFKPQPLSDLMKSPREQMERERNTVSGVQFTKYNRGFVEDNIPADVYAEDDVE